MTVSEQRVEPEVYHSALRGNPSFVWRAGQDRRLRMIVEWGLVFPSQRAKRVLVNGCGVGMYVRALQPYAEEVTGIDIEADYLREAPTNVPGAPFELARCEQLPFMDGAFDLVLSHEVLEHVHDDRMAAAEIVRVLRPGGRAVIFVPNRLWPFETHGHYWKGVYHFGNTPLINYLPNRWRNILAPHVRVYTGEQLRQLFVGQPVYVVLHTQIYPGYDSLSARNEQLGRWARRITYALEHSPLAMFGISHFLVIQKSDMESEE